MQCIMYDVWGREKKTRALVYDGNCVGVLGVVDGVEEGWMKGEKGNFQ